MTPAETLAAFDDGTLDPAGFGHRGHVLAAREALRQAEFLGAADRFAAGLRLLPDRAGQRQRTRNWKSRSNRSGPTRDQS